MTKPPKKICLAIHSLGIGGMERVMSQLATVFSEKEDVEVHLVLFGRKREVMFPLPEKVRVYKPSFVFNNKWRNWNTLKTLFFLRSTIKRIHPDTILGFGEMWNNLLLLSMWGTSFPVFVSDRSQPNKDLGRLHNYLKKKLYPKATGLLAQTAVAAEIARKNNLNENIEVIGNPIRNVPRLNVQKENIVLFVGRLIPTKNVDRLIRLFHEVRKPGWKLVVVGGDSGNHQLLDAYRDLIFKLGAENFISLEGAQADADPYFRKSSIFAFPSSSEGFPNVIGEALSAGLPVVAYDCIAGPAEMIIDDVNGYLIPLFDDQEFKKKLSLLMEDETLRRTFEQNSIHTIQKFSLEVISNQVFEFILQGQLK